jgi:hypothetical protein
MELFCSRIAEVDPSGVEAVRPEQILEKQSALLFLKRARKSSQVHIEGRHVTRPSAEEPFEKRAFVELPIMEGE